MKYKLGQRVKIIKAISDMDEEYVGKIGRIAKSYGGHGWVLSGKSVDGSIHMHEDQLKLVKPKKKIFKKVAKKNKDQIYNIESAKRTNGWTVYVSYKSGAMKMFIAKDLGKFITKLTK